MRSSVPRCIAQFRPWESQGFFIKGGAGMAFVRNFVPTAGPGVDAGPIPDVTANFWSLGAAIVIR